MWIHGGLLKCFYSFLVFTNCENWTAVTLFNNKFIICFNAITTNVANGSLYASFRLFCHWLENIISIIVTIIMTKTYLNDN